MTGRNHGPEFGRESVAVLLFQHIDGHAVERKIQACDRLRRKSSYVQDDGVALPPRDELGQRVVIVVPGLLGEPRRKLSFNSCGSSRESKRLERNDMTEAVAVYSLVQGFWFGYQPTLLATRGVRWHRAKYVR